MSPAMKQHSGKVPRHDPLCKFSVVSVTPGLCVQCGFGDSRLNVVLVTPGLPVHTLAPLEKAEEVGKATLPIIHKFCGCRPGHCGETSLASGRHREEC